MNSALIFKAKLLGRTQNSPNHNMYILYYLFGEDVRYKSELIYSLMSLKKVTSSAKLSNIIVVVYSDHCFTLPDHLNFIEIQFIVIDKRLITEWLKAANNHFFILKPMILLEFQKKFNAPCILMDSDTFFIKDPTPLFKKVKCKTFFTHLKECQFSEFHGMSVFFENRSFIDLKGNSFSIDSDLYMFNCGVIGFYPECIFILHEVVNLICQIASSKEWPEHWSRLIEQVSFSYYIQHYNLKNSVADPTIIHYWFFKGFRHLLANKFNYFHVSDEQILIKEIAKVPYNLFPEFVAELMKHHSLVPTFLLKFLPAESLIGNLLRDDN